MRRPLIAGNWKMYKTVSAGIALAREIAEGLRPSGPEVVVFPPATALHAVAQALKGTAVKVGGQNMHFAREGAFTGEVSSLMLKDIGISRSEIEGIARGCRPYRHSSSRSWPN